MMASRGSSEATGGRVTRPAPSWRRVLAREPREEARPVLPDPVRPERAEEPAHDSNAARRTDRARIVDDIAARLKARGRDEWLALFQAASWTRYVRSAALDVVKLDYVTTARSKGLKERVVVMKHVVRNAMIPVVTLVALQVPAIFGGAIVTEQIFRVPGIGSLLISAILANDTPVIMAVTFVFSCLVIFFNLLADILYAWLDPRIALS